MSKKTDDQYVTYDYQEVVDLVVAIERIFPALKDKVHRILIEHRAEDRVDGVIVEVEQVGPVQH